ncbi:MAG: DEAD/DEAH box helicase [Lewinella sp.]|nr:DEAD/DEAH box helicase [Lewinella sp.]
MTFKDLGIIPPILKALEAKGYTHPTPIQEQAIPVLLEEQDLLACAQTGTGKTAAFSIPILQHLYEAGVGKEKGFRPVRCLIVTPTRELAIQIDDNLKAYGKYTHLRHMAIFGGVKQGRQTERLVRGVDVLVATPGRLLDLMSQGFISLDTIEYFVLDEADRMLDMGFIHDIKRIIAKLPDERQSLFFSATLPPDIVKLSHRILGTNPAKVAVTPEQATAEKVDQAIYFVKKQDKRHLLVHLLETEPMDTTLVFSRTKHGADKIVRILRKHGIKADAIHGNKSQNARQNALGAFKDGTSDVLVATDIAARGIDVSELSRVINYDLPNVPETYVHRIGRTGRAQASGIALSFCDGEERAYLRTIERLIDQRLPIIEDHPYVDDGSEDEAPAVSQGQTGRNGNPQQQRQQRSQGQGQGRNGRRKNRSRSRR